MTRMSPPSRLPWRPTGMTLVELLISMVILAMAAGVVVGLLVTAKNTWQASATHVAVTQDLQVAATRMISDLRDGSVETLTDNTAGTPVGFSLLSARDAGGTFVTDNGGLPVGQKVVIYYIPDGTRRLLRKEVYGSFTVGQTHAQLTSACADGKGSLCASNVTSLRLVPNPSDHSAMVYLTCQAANTQGRIDRQSRTFTVLMRN